MELGSHDEGGGSQEYRNFGACKESVEQVLIECASYGSPVLDFIEYLKRVLHFDALETYINNSILDKTAFCLGEKQGTLINDISACMARQISVL